MTLVLFEMIEEQKKLSEEVKHELHGAKIYSQAYNLIMDILKQKLMNVLRMESSWRFNLIQ